MNMHTHTHTRTQARTRTSNTMRDNSHATHVLLVCTRPDTHHAEALRLTHGQHLELVRLAREVQRDPMHRPIHWYSSKVRVVVHVDSVEVSWTGSTEDWHTQLMCQRTWGAGGVL